jgi:hypothetical protein
MLVTANHATAAGLQACVSVGGEGKLWEYVQLNYEGLDT